jgi:hypothetical protein
MKTLLIAAVLSLTIFAAGQAQEKYLSKNGHVWFHGQTPMEDIEAHNNEVASMINTKTGDIIYQILIKSFKFKRALMEEHFNENYMESSKYPKSDFKGKIANLGDIDFLKNGVYKATVEGTLTIHNKANKVKQNGTIEVKDGKLIVKSKFNIAPTDYDIEIPAAVRDKIAKSMDVTVDMTYEPYKK